MSPPSSIGAQWEREQKELFAQEWEEKWSHIFLEEDLLSRTLDLNYENFYKINQSFGKLDKALQICDFLEELAEGDPPQDTEKIRITTLVSLAEAVYRINNSDQTINEHLVAGFFKPVRNELRQKIRGYIEGTEREAFCASDVLYFVRNDYIHNGNFTGVFFRDFDSEEFVYNTTSVIFAKREVPLVFLTLECESCLTYEQFKVIFLKAFIENIKIFVKSFSLNP